MKKILFVVNVDWFFISHRLSIAQEALKRGYDVHIACALTNKKEFLEQQGFHIHPLKLSRSATNLFKESSSLIELYGILKEVQANIVHFITVKPIIYGGIASKFFDIEKIVFSISGLGYIFIAKGFKASLRRLLITSLYKLALKSKTSHVIVQNDDDQKIVANFKDIAITKIRGSGVDLETYLYTKEPKEPLKVTMASRLLRDKGVFEYIQSAKMIRTHYPNVTFELYGDKDEGNRATLTDAEIKKIKNEGVVQLHGFSDAIAEVFSKSNIVVLPSYREGLPKVLIEAAACGRAVVTTDVTGCKDAIEPNITGLLCAVRNPNSLAEAIEKLLSNPMQREQMGKAGRALAQREFDIKAVVQKHFEIYESNR